MSNSNRTAKRRRRQPRKTCDELIKIYHHDTSRNTELKYQIISLKKEKEELERILANHLKACPKERATINNHLLARDGETGLEGNGEPSQQINSPWMNGWWGPPGPAQVTVQLPVETNVAQEDATVPPDLSDLDLDQLPDTGLILEEVVLRDLISPGDDLPDFLEDQEESGQISADSGCLPHLKIFVQVAWLLILTLSLGCTCRSSDKKERFSCITRSSKLLVYNLQSYVLLDLMKAYTS